MVAADEVSSARISAQVAAAPKPTTVALRSFERLCPKCKAVQHVRRRSCECGHVL
jgi:hypothetical protein